MLLQQEHNIVSKQLLFLSKDYEKHVAHKITRHCENKIAFSWC